MNELINRRTNRRKLAMRLLLLTLTIGNSAHNTPNRCGNRNRDDNDKAGNDSVLTAMQDMYRNKHTYTHANYNNIRT